MPDQIRKPVLRGRVADVSGKSPARRSCVISSQVSRLRATPICRTWSGHGARPPRPGYAITVLVRSTGCRSSACSGLERGRWSRGGSWGESGRRVLAVRGWCSTSSALACPTADLDRRCFSFWRPSTLAEDTPYTFHPVEAVVGAPRPWSRLERADLLVLVDVLELQLPLPLEPPMVALECGTLLPRVGHAGLDCWHDDLGDNNPDSYRSTCTASGPPKVACSTAP
jgi:hypothetical protein